MAGKKGRKYYSEEFKQQVANEYMRGETNMPGLMQKYGIASFASVSVWVHKYGYKDCVDVSNKKPRIPSKTKQSEYSKKLYAKFMQGIETGITPEFDNDTEKLIYALFENQYLKKKLLDMGEPKSSLANLWSSKNLKDLLARFGLVDVSE